MHKYIVSSEIKSLYPLLSFWGASVTGVHVTKELTNVTAKKKKILKDFREMHNTETIKKAYQVEAIRDLFQMMHIPANEITAVENLTNLLYKSGLPSINSVVDSCNIASLATCMPIGVFDQDKISGDVMVSLSKGGEEYSPIGKNDEVLKEGILVFSDSVGVFARPMYKDSKRTMVTSDTNNLLVVTVEYPPILENDVKKALEIALDIVTLSSGGMKDGIFRFA